MPNKDNIFFKKKILIYGLGKSGLSSYRFLKKNNQIYLYDDNKIKNQNLDVQKKIIHHKNIIHKKIDFIIISPGIDIKKCKLKNFLKKNFGKIHTDLDVFYNYNKKNKNITITGTNGKSTTVKIIHEVLKCQKIDARLVGNIGNPILSEKKITPKTVFIIEASSYQLEYSKIFKSHIAAILNISPDHLERHGSIRNYIKAKFKLIKSQTKKDITFLNTNNLFIRRYLSSQKFLSKIIKINKKVQTKVLKKIDNANFLSDGNKENLSFVFEIAKKIKISKNNLFKALNKFNGLDFRQQVIFKSKRLTIINDSKATSFSSTVSILRSITNVYWIVGGQAKKGDKFLLNKNECKNIKAYIFGKNKNLFKSELKRKIDYQLFDNLKSSIKKVLIDIKKNDENLKKHVILFSPAAASFDSFKNFEDRGNYFNHLIKGMVDVK
jgi:UDP-N-acetylmuramoylalanine--D-glutamate ligase